jgi:hypothetical protein
MRAGGTKDTIFSMSDFPQNYIKLIIQIYGLELDCDRVDTFLVTWFEQYDSAWIFKAIVESVYRGRYKIVSVDNILKDWQRIGQPRYNFTPEYEREIVHKIPQLTPQPIDRISPISSDVVVELPAVDAQSLSSIALAAAEEKKQELTSKSTAIQPPIASYNHLNPEESAPFQSHHLMAIDRANHQPSVSGGDAIVVADDKSGYFDVKDVKAEHRHEFRPLSKSQETRQKIGYPNNRCGKSELERIIAQPAQRKLFNTLRAIVDPNNQQETAVNEESVSFQSFAVGNRATTHLAQSRVPVEPIGEERNLRSFLTADRSPLH